MAGKVLVLNQDYRALTVCSVQRAFLLVYMQKAELVSNAENFYLRTVSSLFPAPSIIRLHSYVNIPYKGVVLSRQNIFKRDGHSCQYCGTHSDLTLDHVLPRSRGGQSSWDNLVAACKSCNSKKGDQTPDEASMPLKRKPFKPSFFMFLREFSGNIQEDWLVYLGKGGRA
ncbi:MAG: HNH endonuclease [Cytophagaceae bacterium]|jgi:5-methylcytosine-specific restriction endonuclease McrA|nr:HNH endonuclease [Cytophagaceae bacterium]